MPKSALASWRAPLKRLDMGRGGMAGLHLDYHVHEHDLADGQPPPTIDAAVRHLQHSGDAGRSGHLLSRAAMSGGTATRTSRCSGSHHDQQTIKHMVGHADSSGRDPGRGTGASRHDPKRACPARLGRPVQVVNEIIDAQKAITPDTALELEMVLGINAQYWANLESRYRITLTWQRAQDEQI